MNFKKVLLALVAIGALLVSSCRINDDGAIVPVNIAVSQDYLELDSTAGTYSVKLFSNTPWKGEIVVSNPYKDEAENALVFGGYEVRFALLDGALTLADVIRGIG